MTTLPIRPTGDTDCYFANLEDPTELCASLEHRISEYRRGVRRMPIYERWVRTYRSYFGLPDSNDWTDDTAPRPGGQGGEQTLQRMNHLGNLGRHLLAMTTATRPSFEPVATNTDSTSVAQVEFCRTLLDYYMDHERLAAVFSQATELALIYGLGYVGIAWDENTGPTVVPSTVDPQTGAVQDAIKAGGLTFKTYSPLDVAIDHRRRDQVRDWAIVTTYENRWDLIAQYPDPETQELLRGAAAFNPQDEWYRSFYPTTDLVPNPDIIAVNTFWHEKTPAVPQGKWARFIPGLLLDSGALPQPEMPLYSIVPGIFHGTVFGDSPLHTVVGLQALVDNLYSAVVTNNVNLAVQMLEVPQEARYNIKTAFNGMRIFETKTLADGRSTSPKPIQLTASSPETYKLIELTIQAMETLTGVNSVVRGDPEASLRSGKALALIKAQAVEFSSWLVFSYESLITDVGTAIVRHLKAFAKRPQLAAIAGIGKAWAAKSFDSTNLENIDRVLVRSGNPVSKQLAFRAQAAESLLEKGLLKSPAQYFAIVDTGQLDIATEDDVASWANLKAENEALLAGPGPDVPPPPPPPPPQPGQPPSPFSPLAPPDGGVPVLWTDNPVEHIHWHLDLLSNPLSRKDPQLVARVLNHIQTHIQVNEQADPQKLMLLGIPSIAAALQQAFGPPPGSKPPGGAAPGHGAPPSGPGPQGAPGGPPPGKAAVGPPSPQPTAPMAPIAAPEPGVGGQ